MAILSRIHRQDWQFVPPSLQKTLETSARPVYFHTQHFEAGVCIEAHQHDFWQFALARQGLMQCQVGEMIMALPSQYGIWVPPHCVHTQWVSEKMELEILCIDETLITMRDRSLRVVMVDDFVRAFVHRCCTHIPLLYDAREGQQIAVLLDLIQSLPDAPFNLPFPTEPRLLEVCLAVQNAPDLPHTCDEAAKIARMSSRTFSRHFLKATGLPYHTWRQRMRLLCSLEMLRAGMSVTEVALEVGYATPSAFIYAFRQLFSTSPNRFAKSG